MAEEDGQVGAALNVAEHEQRNQEHPGDHQQWEQARVLTGLPTHTHIESQPAAVGAPPTLQEGGTHPVDEGGDSAAEPIAQVKGQEAADSNEEAL